MARKKTLKTTKLLADLSEESVSPEDLHAFCHKAMATAAPALIPPYLESLERDLKDGKPEARREVADIFRMRPQPDKSGSVFNVLMQTQVESPKKQEAPGNGRFDSIIRMLDEPRRDQRGVIDTDFEELPPKRSGSRPEGAASSDFTPFSEGD